MSLENMCWIDGGWMDGWVGRCVLLVFKQKKCITITHFTETPEYFQPNWTIWKKNCCTTTKGKFIPGIQGYIISYHMIHHLMVSNYILCIQLAVLQILQNENVLLLFSPLVVVVVSKKKWRWEKRGRTTTGITWKQNTEIYADTDVMMMR